MRVKKQRRHRKAVRFFSACFGFREPFKVLCDGTFVHHLLANRLTPADTALANILSGTVKLFTTRCVLAELKSLGGAYREALNAANNLVVARCDHEKRKSAVACVTDVIGQDNPEHFFVATQDAELRRSLQMIPGVPVIYALRNALFLDKPSSLQRQFAKDVEEKRLHMSDLHYSMLRVRRRKRRSSDEEQGDSSDAAEEEVDDVSEVQATKTTVNRNGSDVKDKIRFKRKKAKGPNPLSVKKKKIMDSNVITSGKENDDGDRTVRSRRKRKRHNKHKNVVEGNA